MQSTYIDDKLLETAFFDPKLSSIRKGLGLIRPINDLKISENSTLLSKGVTNKYKTLHQWTKNICFVLMHLGVDMESL